MSDPRYVSAPAGRAGAAPRDVVRATALTVVLSGLFGIWTLVSALVVGGDAASAGLGELGNAVVFVGVVYTGFCVLAVVGALLAARGSNAWRITVLVLGSLWAVLSLLGLVESIAAAAVGSSVVNAVAVAGTVAAIVLYLRPDSNRFFAARTADQRRGTGY